MKSVDDHQLGSSRQVPDEMGAFYRQFIEFRPQLKSFLYRLLVDRNDVEDIAQDTFVRAYERLGDFRGDSSLKTWVFRIASNLALDMLRKKGRWPLDAQDRSRSLAMSTPSIAEGFLQVNRHSPHGAYVLKEHIDFCFTCLAKTLPIQQQIALILKDVYDFSISEICMVLDLSSGVVKHLLHDARSSMEEIFEHRCALISKNGMCEQCSELAGYFNPRQHHREELLDIEMVREAGRSDAAGLYSLRAKLVSAIDPLRSEGAVLQDIIMQCTRQAIGEIGSYQHNPIPPQS
jgi:RNA polymerase sigma-70 factor (ECF subfamily)